MWAKIITYSRDRDRSLPSRLRLFAFGARDGCRKPWRSTDFTGHRCHGVTAIIVTCQVSLYRFTMPSSSPTAMTLPEGSPDTVQRSHGPLHSKAQAILNPGLTGSSFGTPHWCHSGHSCLSKSRTRKSKKKNVDAWILQKHMIDPPLDVCDFTWYIIIRVIEKSHSVPPVCAQYNAKQQMLGYDGSFATMAPLQLAIPRCCARAPFAAYLSRQRWCLSAHPCQFAKRWCSYLLSWKPVESKDLVKMLHSWKRLQNPQ